MRFALNHMTAPSLGYDALLSLASQLGCAGVEFRNDLAAPLFGGADPGAVARAARAQGLRIFALAEVKAFNAFTDDTRARAAALIETAVACGAEAVSLIPRNDGQRITKAERQADLATALREIAPLLKARGMIGLVEPLGFESCPLRHKSEAVETIEALGLADCYRLVHDTFHHHLAGGGPLFADHTGMVHISGVTDPSVTVDRMRDGHRVLVDGADRLDNLGQIAALRDAGYDGPLSFEPFAPEIHALADPEPDLARSIEFIESRLGKAAA